MAGVGKFYGLAFKSAFEGKIAFTSDSIYLMLVGSGYVPDQDTHQFKSDITNEVVGAGYTAGGAVVAGCGITYTAGTNTLTLTGGDVSWPASTITARYGVLYDRTPATDAARPLLAYIDFQADVVSSGGPFDAQWDAAGIATVTVT